MAVTDGASVFGGSDFSAGVVASMGSAIGEAGGTSEACCSGGTIGGGVISISGAGEAGTGSSRFLGAIIRAILARLVFRREMAGGAAGIGAVFFVRGVGSGILGGSTTGEASVETDSALACSPCGSWGEGDFAITGNGADSPLDAGSTVLRLINRMLPERVMARRVSASAMASFISAIRDETTKEDFAWEMAEGCGCCNSGLPDEAAGLGGLADTVATDGMAVKGMEGAFSFVAGVEPLGGGAGATGAAGSLGHGGVLALKKISGQRIAVKFSKTHNNSNFCLKKNITREMPWKQESLFPHIA